MLQNMQQDFCDAAESYQKDGCFRHAQKCLRMARLVALQLVNLGTEIKVLHLDSDGVNKFINTHSKFYEVFNFRSSTPHRSRETFFYEIA